MDCSLLLPRLEAYGADIAGIQDRFMGDNELYGKCLTDFFNETNFALLETSMATGCYDDAFKAAHALKGLSGNLGVTPFYDTLCVLVEALRAKDYSDVDRQFADVMEAERRLEAAAEGREYVLPSAPEEEAAAAEEHSDDAPEAPQPAESRAKERRKKHKIKRDPLIPVALISLLVIVGLVVVMFTGLIRSYRESTTSESSRYLEEISRQIAQYMEEYITNDWRTTYSIADAVGMVGFDDDSALLSYLHRERDIYGVSDITVYTENGSSINCKGSSASNDVASELVYQARQRSEYLTIVDSALCYTLPVSTQQTYNGEKIAAVSINRDLASFLDEMNFSSFDGTAYAYMTTESGAIISSLSHEDEESAYNIHVLRGDKPLDPLSGGNTPENAFSVTEATTYLLRDSKKGDKYVVATPLATQHEPMWLFYIVPEAEVNETINSFTSYVASLCAVVIVVVTVLVLVTFVLFYKSRKRKFDRALDTRERMLELLVHNTGTAFALYVSDSEAPVYVSDNVDSIIGGSVHYLERSGGRFRLYHSGGEETPASIQLGEELRDWDGKSEFHSSILKNEAAQPPIYYEIQLYPVGEIRDEYICIAQNMNSVYLREAAAKEALVMAETANAAKSRFLSNMSHDIRTPMNAIINMTDFAIESMGEPKEQLQYLRTIQESSDHLLGLINDVLDMSRIESGQAVIGSVPFNIKEELKKLTAIVGPLCKAKSQTFITDFSKVYSSAVMGDQIKLSQILMNLLSNAVKFTPNRGAVRFTAVELPSINEHLVDLRFTIEDNGIGISPEHQQHIFEPFNRVDDKRVSAIEGTGLGLSICHSYVTAMGGNIKCASAEGEGSTFTVELFFARANSVPVPAAKTFSRGETPFLGMRCLLCEDNATNQLIAKKLLERLGFMVDTAADGAEGLEIFRLSHKGQYAIIYMDIQMPVLDGYQAAVAIRESEHPDAKTIPIVAMTANVFAEDMEKARIAGMDGHLSKPITTMTVVEETSRVLGSKRGK